VREDTIKLYKSINIEGYKMRYITIVISIIYLSFLYGENNIIVYGISNDMYDAIIKAKMLQRKINHSKLFKEKLIVNTIKMDDRWLLVSYINDNSMINKISILVKDKYPSILIIKDSKETQKTQKNKESSLKYSNIIQKPVNNNTKIEWITLILIAILGILSMIWLLRKISGFRKIQNELEKQQIKLLNKILKSERHDV